MGTLIIGSTAMSYHFPLTRPPKDFDVFSDVENIPNADVYWHPSFSGWLSGQFAREATVDELYTIKVSHSYWELKNGSWEKHINDAAFLKGQGAALIPDLHDLLYKVWTEKHGSKRMRLQQEAGEFFKDAVVRKYVHDSIHESVAYGDRPMYESILKDGASVDMDMGKLKALPFGDKIRLFREEVYATALERLIIPNDYRYSPRRAYAWALRRTITSLTKGWSAQFLVEHYDDIRVPDVDYVAVHLANKHKLIPLEV